MSINGMVCVVMRFLLGLSGVVVASGCSSVSDSARLVVPDERETERDLYRGSSTQKRNLDGSRRKLFDYTLLFSLMVCLGKQCRLISI